MKKFLLVAVATLMLMGNVWAEDLTPQDKKTFQAAINFYRDAGKLINNNTLINTSNNLEKKLNTNTFSEYDVISLSELALVFQEGIYMYSIQMPISEQEKLADKIEALGDKMKRETLE